MLTSRGTSGKDFVPLIPEFLFLFYIPYTLLNFRANFKSLFKSGIFPPNLITKLLCKLHVFAKNRRFFAKADKNSKKIEKKRKQLYHFPK